MTIFIFFRKNGMFWKGFGDRFDNNCFRFNISISNKINVPLELSLKGFFFVVVKENLGSFWAASMATFSISLTLVIAGVCNTIRSLHPYIV
jgi:hypothetical protein